MRAGQKLCLLFILIISTGWGGCYNVSAPYSWGPACQWIRLYGEVEPIPDAEDPGSLELTVTYQLPRMNRPATLLTNQPLRGRQFKFVLAGFDSQIEGAVFVKPMFLFAKQIVFRYYVASADKKWISETAERVFFPPRLPKVATASNRKREFLCRTGINLGKIRVKPVRRDI